MLVETLCSTIKKDEAFPFLLHQNNTRMFFVLVPLNIQLVFILKII